MKSNAKITQLVTATRDIKAGESIQEADILSRTVTTLTCHNPKCNVEITWCQEDVAKDQDAAPEAFFRILTLQRSYVDPALQAEDPGKYAFCSAYCLIQWLKYGYEPSCSPAETRRRQENQAAKNISAAVEKDRDAGTGQDAIPENGIEPGVTMPTVEVAPLAPEPEPDFGYGTLPEEIASVDAFVGIPGVVEPEPREGS